MTIANSAPALSATAQLAADLIRIDSVTPDDKGCNQVLADRLARLGFEIEHLRFGEVNNFWARYGRSGPVLCFAGHTDVVPSGPEEQWESPPFQPTVRNGNMYGRGAADMKGSLAAMVTACERLLPRLGQSGRQLAGSIAFLITSDEEGEALNGTRKVVETLEQRGEKISWCIVGEPSSTDQLGDVIKVGRRGSLHGYLTVHGIQGHVAYPHLAKNSVHQSLLPLAALAKESWDEGNDAFPPTTFQISNINSGTGADNVIPGQLRAHFNFRFSTELTEQSIRQRTHAILDSFDLDYHIDWVLSGLPFLTESPELLSVVSDSVAEITGIRPRASTDGGTSDGRFIAPTGAQVVELGPCNATIHKVNEYVRLAELDQLTLIYELIIERLLLGPVPT